MGVEIRDEEGENNINNKEDVDNAVKYEESSVLVVGKKCELEGRNPGRVDDEKNQKGLPSPVLVKPKTKLE